MQHIDDVVLALNAKIDKLWQERDEARTERDHYRAAYEAYPPEPSLVQVIVDVVSGTTLVALAAYGVFSGFMAIFY